MIKYPILIKNSGIDDDLFAISIASLSKERKQESKTRPRIYFG